MEKEIKDEIGITNDKYNLIPLAFSRELVRGGKPQLFLDIDISALKAMMHNAEENWEFIKENDLPDDSPLKKHLHAPLEATQEMFSYEGFMAFKIIQAYMNRTDAPFPIVDY